MPWFLAFGHREHCFHSRMKCYLRESLSSLDNQHHAPEGIRTNTGTPHKWLYFVRMKKHRLKKETGHSVSLAMTNKAQTRKSGPMLQSMSSTRKYKRTSQCTPMWPHGGLCLKSIIKDRQNMQISSSFCVSYGSQSSYVKVYIYSLKRIILIIF